MNEMLAGGWLYYLGGIAAVLGFLWNIQRSLHRDIAGVHRDIAGIHRDIADLHRNMGDLRERVNRGMGDLRERMARLEGLLEGFVQRESTPAA